MRADFHSPSVRSSRLILVASLTHVLLSTMRRRRADLAVLRAIGWRPRELVATMRWQVLVLCGTALLIGVPLGLVGGRIAWNFFTHELGVAPGIVWPIGFIAAAVVVLLVLAGVLATVAGSRVPRLAQRYRLTG